MFRQKKGFTLIELLVAVMLVGILASIAAPIMYSMKARAICAEGVAGMSAVRAALRAYYTEYRAYPPIAISGFLSERSPAELAAYFPGLSYDGLQGTYFGKECYRYYQSQNGLVLEVECYVVPNDEAMGFGHAESSAPRRQETYDIRDRNTEYDSISHLTLNLVTGNITQINISRSGYPSEEQ